MIIIDNSRNIAICDFITATLEFPVYYIYNVPSLNHCHSRATLIT